MLRQVSSRNHRSKGFKLKNALQLCLLVVVTIWLLYQVKHSYDKKTRYEEHDAHLSIKHDDGDGDGDRRRRDVFKLPGRKDLPRTVGRTEDEESEDDEVLEQELLKREESDERDAIDEQDHPESEESDGDEPSVFEDAESGKEGAHAAAAAREESFRGDDVASAVVVRAGRPEEHGDHSREAREKSFNGDNVSSAVAHEDHLESAENKAAGGENSTVVDSTSDRASEFSSDGGGSKDREASSNSTVDEPDNHAEPRVDPTTTNVVGNQIATPTADEELREKPMNTTTTALNNQIELLTNLTVPEQNETTNLGSSSGSARDGNDTVIQIPGDDQFNTSSTTSSASSERGERKVEFQDTTRNMADEMRDVPNAKIEERAKSGEEVVLE